MQVQPAFKHSVTDSGIHFFLPMFERSRISTIDIVNNDIPCARNVVFHDLMIENQKNDKSITEKVIILFMN
jgi:hypothetical protein